MFDLLTNILIWIIVIPIFVILFRAIPKDWFRLFGLIIFTALIVIIFANFRFVEEPIPRVVVEFLTFPFTLVGIVLLLLFFNWLRIKDLKIKRANPAFYETFNLTKNDLDQPFFHVLADGQMDGQDRSVASLS